MPPAAEKPRRSTRNVQTRLSFEPRSSAPSSAISPARITYEHPRMRNRKNLSSSAGSQPHISAGDEDDVFANGKKYAVVVRSSPKSKNSSQFPATSFMGAASSSVNKRGKSRKTPAYQTRDDSSSDEDIPRAETPQSKKKPAFLKDDSESPLESPAQATVRGGVAQTRKKQPSTKSPTPKTAKNISTRSFIAGGQLTPGSMATPQSAKSKSGRLSANKSASHKLKKKEKEKEKEKETVALSSDEDSDSNDQESSDDEQKVTAIPSRKRARESEDEDSDEIVERHSSARKRQPSNRPAQADSDDEKVYPSLKRRRLAEEDSDDEPIQSSPAKRRKPLRPQSDDSENDSIPVSRRLEELSEEDSDDEPIQSSPAKRRKPLRPEEKDKEDSRPRTRPKKHRTEKQKKLEIIMRRRAGEKIDELTESSEEEAERGVYDTDSDAEVLSVFDDEDSEDGIEGVRQSLKRNVRDENDDSFVVEDDDEPLGVPSYGLHDIPLEFTHQAHKPLREHFKDAVEWMVQRQINPSFNRRDPIYVQAFYKLEDGTRRLAESKFSSSVWAPAFTRALWARPVFHEEDIGLGDEGADRKCDACGRSKYPVRFRVQLKGKPYHQDSLEEVDNEEEGDSGPDDDASVNCKGEELPREDREYYLGRHCKANAERAHSLLHWKHALNEWVVAALEKQGYLAPEKLAERVRWSQRKLSDFANGIVDEWVDVGEIKALYRDFDNNLEAARSDTQDRWNA